MSNWWYKPLLSTIVINILNEIMNLEDPQVFDDPKDINLLLEILCLSNLPHPSTITSFFLWKTMPKLKLIRVLIPRQVQYKPFKKIYIVWKTCR